MDFIIITRIPPKQGLLGVIPEQYALDSTSAESVDEVKTGLHVPFKGYCMIVNEDDVTWVTSVMVNRLEKPDKL